MIRKSVILSSSYGPQEGHPTTYLTTIIILTYFFEVKDCKRDNLSRLNAIISQMVTDRANITIANTFEVDYWLSIVKCTFDFGPF